MSEFAQDPATRSEIQNMLAENNMEELEQRLSTRMSRNDGTIESMGTDMIDAKAWNLGPPACEQKWDLVSPA